MHGQGEKAEMAFNGLTAPKHRLFWHAEHVLGTCAGAEALKSRGLSARQPLKRRQRWSANGA